MKIHNAKDQKNAIIGPATAVDVLILDIREEKLNALLLQISQGPYESQWALPGGLVQINESLDGAAQRVLQEKAGIRGVYLEQLYTFGDPKRDVRGRIISVAYFALVQSDKFHPKTTEYYRQIEWKDVYHLPDMAFDHRRIISLGIERLRNKIEYSNIAYGLLPKEFTLPDMQRVYEIILNKKLDKRNFRKKMLSLHILDRVERTQRGYRNRPADLYQFKKRSLVLTQ